MSGYELKSVKPNQVNRSALSKQLQSQVAQDIPTVGGVDNCLIRDTPLISGSEKDRPLDRYNIVFFILLLHGIGTLMPWNMFINAEVYFRNYKLAPSSNTSDPSSIQNEPELTSIRENFLPYLGVAAQVPNLICNGLNLVVNLGSGNLRHRVNLTLAIEACIFALTIALAVINSSGWKILFFYITMLSVVVLNMASGVYQNCVFGIGAKFPGSYTNAILIGSNLCGTFTSTVNLLSIWLAPEPQEAAIYYFVTALVVIMACIISYNLLTLNPFYNYHELVSQSNAKSYLDHESSRELMERRFNDDIPESFRETVDSIVPKSEGETNLSCFTQLKENWSILKKCWPQCLNVFLTFYVTLALFPAILADIRQLQNKFDEKFFSSFACFFVFNVFAMVGNLISSRTTWPGKDRVWIAVVARFLFVPFFLFCNYNSKKRHWPVLIENDKIYIIGNVLFALTSGYLSSLCMMFASRDLRPDEAPKAGMLAAFFLVFGIFMGVNSSFLLSWLVTI